MTTVLNQYFVPCLTEGVGVLSGYQTDPPTTCPHDTNHTIDPLGIRVNATITDKIVTINQNGSFPTNQYGRIDGHTQTMNPNTVTTYDITYPYPVNIFAMVILPTADNIGDTFEVLIGPNTPIGQLPSAISSGETDIFLSSIGNIFPGLKIKITDGINTDDLGEITAIDFLNLKITVSVPTVNSFGIGSIVTISYPKISNFKITTSESIALGELKIRGSGLPAGKIARLNYTNNSAVSKTFSFYIPLEY